MGSGGWAGGDQLFYGGFVSIWVIYPSRLGLTAILVTIFTTHKTRISFFTVQHGQFTSTTERTVALLETGLY